MFSGAFAKLRKATVKFVMSVCPSVCLPHGTTCTHEHAYVHAPGQTQAHTRTHTQIYNVYCFSTAITIRERASILRYTYIVCLVKITDRSAIPQAPRAIWNTTAFLRERKCSRTPNTPSENENRSQAQ